MEVEPETSYELGMLDGDALGNIAEDFEGPGDNQTAIQHRENEAHSMNEIQIHLYTSVFVDSSEPTTATISGTVRQCTLTTTNALADNERLEQQPDHEPNNTQNAFGKDIDDNYCYSCSESLCNGR